MCKEPPAILFLQSPAFKYPVGFWIGIKCFLFSKIYKYVRATRLHICNITLYTIAGSKRNTAEPLLVSHSLFLAYTREHKGFLCNKLKGAE